MAAPVTYDELSKQAAEKNYKLSLNPDGSIHVVPPRKELRDPAFEKRLSANSGLLKTHLSVPGALGARVKEIAHKNTFEKINEWVNRARDKYLIQELSVDPIGQMIGAEHAGPENVNPLVKAAVKGLIPDS